MSQPETLQVLLDREVPVSCANGTIAEAARACGLHPETLLADLASVLYRNVPDWATQEGAVKEDFDKLGRILPYRRQLRRLGYLATPARQRAHHSVIDVGNTAVLAPFFQLPGGQWWAITEEKHHHVLWE